MMLRDQTGDDDNDSDDDDDDDDEDHLDWRLCWEAMFAFHRPGQRS